MRKLILLSGLLPWIALLAGCPKKGGDAADAAAEAQALPEASVVAVDAAVAPAPAPTPTAKNSADVARFAAETKIENEPARVAIAATARTTPKGGASVATLKPATDVTKIAEHQDCVLIAFADPKDPSTNLMGWVTKDVFTAPVVTTDAGVTDAGITDAGIKDAATKDAAVDAAAPVVVDAGTAAKCGPGLELVTGFGKDPVCKKKCSIDKDCKGAAAGSCAVAAAVSGKVARVCTNE